MLTPTPRASLQSIQTTKSQTSPIHMKPIYKRESCLAKETNKLHQILSSNQSPILSMHEAKVERNKFPFNWKKSQAGADLGRAAMAGLKVSAY